MQPSAPLSEGAQARRSAEAPWRSLQYLGLTRVLLTSALVLLVATANAPSASEPRHQTIFFAVVLAYLLCAVLSALLAVSVRRRFRLQGASSLALDLGCISTLMVLTGGAQGGLAILYLLPLASSALLFGSVSAFFVCSLAVLALLFDTALRALGANTGEVNFFQTGLFGASLFGVTGLLRVLAGRLAAQEQLALLRGRDLQNQLDINRLVIAQMEQGVLVLDASTRVRANNKAARVMLSMQPDAQLTGKRLLDVPTARALAQAFTDWLSSERSAGRWSDALLAAPGEQGGGERRPGAAALRVRARFARPPSSGSDEFIVFLEDVRSLEDRAQQLKLAAMGRLTASIAHEIRNPLAAISHAGQLMAEGLDEGAEPAVQQRLVSILRENTMRLNRLVEDVLRVARREPPMGDELELSRFVSDWVAEFERDRELQTGRIRVEIAAGLRAKFEQSQLRQVLFNLVDNALRYATAQAGAIVLLGERAFDDGGRVHLWVFDDGPGVDPDARAALFEPFFTTHTRGTGLGLYIAREFCLANQAELVHSARRELDGSSRPGFVVRFAVTAQNLDTRGFLDTMPTSDVN